MVKKTEAKDLCIYVYRSKILAYLYLFSCKCTFRLEKVSHFKAISRWAMKIVYLNGSDLTPQNYDDYRLLVNSLRDGSRTVWPRTFWSRTFWPPNRHPKTLWPRKVGYFGHGTKYEEAGQYTLFTLFAGRIRLG